MNEELLRRLLPEALWASAGLRAALLCGCGLLAAAAGAALWLEPAWRALETQRGRNALIEKEIETLQKRGAELRRELRREQSVGEEYRRRAATLPETPEIAAFSRELERAAQAHGARISRIAPGRPLAEDFYRTTPLQLELVGGWRALYGFLSELARSPRALRLAAVELQAQNEGAELRADLTLQLHCCISEPLETPAPPRTEGGARAEAEAEEQMPAEATQAAPALPAAPAVSPFGPGPAAAAETGETLEEVGGIRHRGRRWRLLRDVRGKVRREEY